MVTGNHDEPKRVTAAFIETRSLDEILSEVGRYCDIEERLSLVPPSAKARGVYCRSIESALREAHRLQRYRELFPRELGTLQWHPCGELLRRLVVGAALLVGPERVHEGMVEIGRRNALEFARSLLGRMLMRLLSSDPKKLLLQGIAGRRQTCNYGNWQLSFPEERTAVVAMVEEYFYIDTYALGSACGTFEAIGLTVHAECELETKFNGRHVLRW